MVDSGKGTGKRTNEESGNGDVEKKLERGRAEVDGIRGNGRWKREEWEL